MGAVVFLKYTRYAIVALMSTFSFSGSATAEVDGLEIQPHPDNPNRVLIHADALLEDVPGQIDRHLGGHMVFSRYKRVFWNGGTSIRSGGPHLELTSTVRYEQWLCAILKTRIFRSTHPVEWRLDVNEGVRIDNLIATATVTNIKDLSDSLEEWFDLRVEETVRIPIPTECGRCACHELVDVLLPMAERFEFHPQNNARDVLVKATFSTPRDLSAVLRCF